MKIKAKSKIRKQGETSLITTKKTSECPCRKGRKSLQTNALASALTIIESSFQSSLSHTFFNCSNKSKNAQPFFEETSKNAPPVFEA